MLPNAAHAVAPGARQAQDARYAVYFAPRPDSAWWRFGSAWLGRDAVADAPVARPAGIAMDAAYVTRITTEPRRYGFHATLKAPFHLNPEYTARDVYVQAAHLASVLASTCVAATLPRVTLRVIDGFVALGYDREQSGAAAVHAIAAQCVLCFDNLRARPSASELARRLAAALSPRQTSLLQQRGYPFVLDEFRFHFTLTNRLRPEEQQPVIQVLSPVIDALNTRPLLFDALSIYMQPAPDAPFVVTRRYGFDGSVEIYRDDA